jgi:DNA polymerase III sliding clamp (beta) subunit (PCNA family)
MKKEELLKALEIVKPGLTNRDIIEQSNSFAFVNGRVVTYNDEISLSHPVEGLTITGAVKAEELHQLLRKIKKDEVEIVVTDKEITLTAGRAKAGLTLQQEIKLPIEAIGTHGDWQKIPEDFMKALKFAMAACGHDSSQAVLTCVHVNENGFVEGSDNYRVTRYKLAKKLSVGSFLIPATSVKEVIKINPTEIAEGEGWIHFRTASDTILSCRILGDAYPDTAPFLKVKGTEITFPKTIKDILDRAAVFAKQSDAVNEEVAVTLDNKRITLGSQSETGWYNEEANSSYEGEKVEFSIVPYLLRDILDETQVCLYNGSMLKFTGECWEYATAIIEKS